MSAVSSFVIECAQAGRWVRGLMALQDQHLSTELPIRLACVALAQAAAPHSWATALSLLHPSDALRHPQEVCKIIDTVTRHADVHADDLERSIKDYLLALQEPFQSGGCRASGCPEEQGPIALHPVSELSTSITSIQRQIFLSATRWCGWETAARLLNCLPTPPPRPCVERVQALRTLRHCILHDVGPFQYWGSRAAFSPLVDADVSGTLTTSTKGTSLGEQLARMEISTTRRYLARDRRELSRLRDQKRQQLLQRIREEEDTLARQAMTDVSPSVLSVCAALRTMTRLSSPSPSTAPLMCLHQVLTRVGDCRLTPDVALLYGRAAGLCLPHSWRATVDRLNRAEVRDAQLHRLLIMWVISRGNWSAALEHFSELHHDVCSTATKGSDHGGSASRRKDGALALDCVLRTAAPTSYVLRAVPQVSRPWLRLVSSSQTTVSLTRQIAGALAAGVHVDEIQLGEVGKAWVAHGRWREALALYYRFPLPEFQKYAARSIVTARPALASTMSSLEPLTYGVAQGSHPLHRDSSSKDSAVFSVRAALDLLVPPHGVRYDDASPPRPAPPLTTFPASLLIEAASSWSEALAVFRACLKLGTQCKPQILSTLMRHQDLPPQELRQILKSYPAGVNEGVRRRAKDSFGIE